jgi:hypothetical protein
VRRTRLLIVVLTALALALAGTTAASAQERGGGGDDPDRAPEIGWVLPLAWGSGQDQVTVLGTYRCWGDSEATHLWVSVKQGGPDPTAEGSSSTVDAWYDTNISMDVAVTCNGQWQVATVDLGRHPTDFTGRPLAALHSGRAWLQFCLVPPGADEEHPELIKSRTEWVHVVGVGYN